MEFDITTSTTDVATALHSKADDATQYETERGKPMPSKNHAILQGEIYFQLRTNYGRAHDILPEHELELVKRVVPDLCVFPKTERDWLHDTLRSMQPPLLAVEILSPRQLLDDILDKIDTVYFPSNVPSVWVVLPQAQSIMLFRKNQAAKTFANGLLKDDASGFEIDLDKVFA